VNDDFALVFGLLERSPAEVSGRAATVASPEVQKRLAKLAAGNCSDQERHELLVLLEQRPELVAALAKKIKALRKS
jgi:hypothetical protein